jgi:hypothetical protein
MADTRVGSGIFAAAGRTLLVSGALAAIGVAFLFAMFGSFGVGSPSQAQDLGRINDILILISYLLTAPTIVAFGAILRPSGQLLSRIVTVVGLAAIAAIVVLQLMLITGTLTFEQQVGPVTVALLVLGAWFVVTGRMATSIGFMPNGARMGLLAATYVGYPIWAFWVGRRFLGWSGVAGRSVPNATGADEASW